MDRKKFILIAGIIIVILLIISGIVYLIYSKTAQTSGRSTISLVENLDEKAFSPQYITSEESIYYYNQGLLSNYSFLENKISRLNQDKIVYLQKAKFSPDGKRALILVKEGENYYFKSIDFNTQKIIPLSKYIFDASWLSDGKIVYSYSNLDNNEYHLDTADYEGNDVKKLTDLNFATGLIFPSHDKNKIIIYPEPEGYGENFLVMYDFTTQKFTKFEAKGLVGVVWSPDNQRIISNIYNEQGEITSTVILNVSNQKTTDLDMQYQIDKITWLDNDNIVALKTLDTGGDQFRLASAKNGKSKEIKIDKATNFFLDVQYIAAQDNKTILFTSNDFLYVLNLVL